MGLTIKQRKTNKTGKQIKVSQNLSIREGEHSALLLHLVERLTMAKSGRDRYLSIFRKIDREYYTWLKHESDDEIRQRDNAQGKGIKPVDEKLSMIFAQLDEALTYLLTVLAPDEAMYSAIAKKDDQAVAKGFASLMNEHADDFKHYRHLAIFILDCLKYNMGAYGVNWARVTGNIVKGNTIGAPEIIPGVLKEGNALFAYDPYQLLLDPSVSPIDMAELGEYFGYAKLITPFRLQKMEADGELVNVDKFIHSSDTTCKWIEDHPVVRNDVDDSAHAQSWASILTAGRYNDAAELKSLEIIEVYAWLIPKQFGLSKKAEFQIYRITMGGEKHILNVEAMENAHSMLPINISMPYEDHFGWQTKGAAERLIPHQNFASFVTNVHQRATRKRLHGLTIFDDNVIPLLAQDEVDMAGGKIPANSNGQDLDLRKKVVQFTDGPDTTGTLQNVQLMEQLMQGVMPTNIQNQVAGLDRATQYQAAATVQGANRRNLKIAKLLNTQAMEQGRAMQMFNIQQFQPAVEILDDNGEIIEIDPKQIRNTKLRFTISDGLKGLDKLTLSINMKEMFQSILQSQKAAENIDIVGLMDYMSTLWGDHTDLKQFKIESPMDNLPPDQRTQAFEIFQAVLAQQEAAGAEGGAQETTPAGAPV